MSDNETWTDLCPPVEHKILAGYPDTCIYREKDASGDDSSIGLRNVIARTRRMPIQGELPKWAEAYPDGEFITDCEFRETANGTTSKPGPLTATEQYGE